MAYDLRISLGFFEALMVQAIATPLNFDDFLAWYPETGGRYELRHGTVVDMRPIGSHEQVIALIRRKLDLEIERLGLPYFIPQTCLVKPQREGEGYLPDIIVLDQEKSKTILIGRGVRVFLKEVRWA
jgi:Uma2 family endonuclease